MNDTSVFARAEEACAHCEHCTSVCPSLGRAGLDLGQFGCMMQTIVSDAGPSVDALAAKLSENKALEQVVRGCFLCGRCVEACPAHVDVLDMIVASRALYQSCGLIPRSAWSSVQVDRPWHIFSAYRAIYGIGYADLIRHRADDGSFANTDCEVAFFPGCSLAAYNPQLTRAVFNEIEMRAGKTTLIDYCCGSPLTSAGFLDRARALREAIVTEVVGSGAKRIVCTCPGCRNILAQAAEDLGVQISVEMVPSLLLEQGFTPVATHMPLRFFRSCQDYDGSYMLQVRRLFEGGSDAPTLTGGCCGAGGAVSAYQPEQQQERVDTVLSRCSTQETLVSLCPTCTYTFAFRLRQGSSDINAANYLELLFGHPFDWEEVFSRLEGMWSGTYADWLMQVLA